MRLIDADKLDYYLLSYEPIEFIKECIYNEPTVDTWIPVSERLPKTRESVLLQLSCHDIVLGWYDSEYENWFSYELDFNKEEVVAWQPLPEPYEEDKKNETNDL